MFITSCNNFFPTQKCILFRPVYVYYLLKLIVYRKNMEVIKPLHLTPLFDRAPDGPPVKLAIQRHCSYNLTNFTQRSTFNPDRP